MDHDIRHEQIAYYRAQAQEYDELAERSEELKGTFALAKDLLMQPGPFEQVLELACGTGTWTRVLLQIGRHITSTLRKQGIELLSALDHTLSGHPVLPAF